MFTEIGPATDNSFKIDIRWQNRLSFIKLLELIFTAYRFKTPIKFYETTVRVEKR